MHFNFVSFLLDLFLIKKDDNQFIGLNQFSDPVENVSGKEINTFKQKNDVNISDLISGKSNLL